VYSFLRDHTITAIHITMSYVTEYQHQLQDCQMNFCKCCTYTGQRKDPLVVPVPCNFPPQDVDRWTFMYLAHHKHNWEKAFSETNCGKELWALIEPLTHFTEKVEDDIVLLEGMLFLGRIKDIPVQEAVFPQLHPISYNPNVTPLPTQAIGHCYLCNHQHLISVGMNLKNGYYNRMHPHNRPRAGVRSAQWKKEYIQIQTGGTCLAQFQLLRRLCKWLGGLVPDKDRIQQGHFHAFSYNDANLREVDAFRAEWRAWKLERDMAVAPLPVPVPTKKRARPAANQAEDETMAALRDTIRSQQRTIELLTAQLAQNAKPPAYQP